MKILTKHRQLHSLTRWTRTVQRDHDLTQEDLAEKIGITRSNLSAKFVTGMTYNDVEKIANALAIAKPNLAELMLEELKQEIHTLSQSPNASDYGMK